MARECILEIEREKESNHKKLANNKKQLSTIHKSINYRFGMQFSTPRLTYPKTRFLFVPYFFLFIVSSELCVHKHASELFGVNERK